MVGAWGVEVGVAGPLAVGILYVEQPVGGTDRCAQELFLGGGAVEGGPAEDNLSSIEDDGIVVQADAAAHAA